MEVLAHLPKGQTKDMAIETPNLSMEGEFPLTPQMEGVQICTLPINNIEGSNRFTNKTFKPFDRFHCPRE